MSLGTVAFTFLMKTQVAVSNLKRSSLTHFVGTHLVLARTAVLYRGASLVSRVQASPPVSIIPVLPPLLPRSSASPLLVITTHPLMGKELP